MTAELDRFENLLQQLLRVARAEQVSSSRNVGLTKAVTESTGLKEVTAERVASGSRSSTVKTSTCVKTQIIPGSRCKCLERTGSSGSTLRWRTRCARRAGQHE